MKAHYETSERSRELPARRSADSRDKPSSSSSPRSRADGPSTRRDSSELLGKLEDRDDMEKWLRDYPETD